MEREQWLEGVLLPYPRRRHFMQWAKEGGAMPRPVALALADCGSPRQRAERLQRLQSHCTDTGIAICTPADPQYPRRAFAPLEDAPVALFARGDLSLIARDDIVTLIGARRATIEGIAWAQQCGADLARAEAVVASGLAFGIDAAGQRGALEAGGAVIAVLGTGVDRAYPLEHRKLHEAIAAKGCLLSEFAPGSGPRKHHFVARNRILAALGAGLVVVEAGPRSGTLSTVGFAQSLGREVLCVPGFPGRRQHETTLQLLRDGARLVRDARDVLADLELRSLETLYRPKLPGGLAGPARADEIAAACGRSLASILAELGRLEVEGLVRRLPGGYYRVAGEG
jgi:DNA processing protein